MAAVEYPEALFERVHTGNCVLCTGVRLASAAGMPDWAKLFSRMTDKLGGEDANLKRLIEEGKLLTVGGYLKRKLGVDSWAELIQEAYSKGGELPPAHKVLSELPFHAAVTTGYDTLVEKALTRNGTSPKVYTYADGAVLRLSEDLTNYVLKVHGGVDLMEQLGNKLVQSRLDYKRLIGPNHAFRAFVEDLYRTHTLLFVGYHATDPDFILFLEQLVSSFRDAVTDHYAILAGLTDPEMEELYANYRVRVIPYEEGDDPVGALVQALTDLRDQWRDKGAELPGPEDPKQQLEWLKMQLAPVELRIDMVPAQGLDISEGRLNAIRNAAASVDLKEVDPESLIRLGNVNLLLEDVPRAIQCYNAALEQDPDRYEAHLDLHVAQAEAKQLEEALDHLKKAMELNKTLLVVPERYELSKVIGRGSTGSVYQAKDTEEGREVTVKVLRTSYLQEHGSPEGWLKETKEQTKLDHPNLAKVHEVLLEYGKCILVTEGLSGQSLSRLMRQEGHLSPERTTEILQQVCAGLQHAHEQGVLHLDLTPSNVFIRDDGTVAVMDFRSSRARKGRQVTISKEGFQAPELLAGASCDGRTDVYSLGALLYFMLSGQVPLGSFPKLAEVNPVARRYDPLITKALRALPDERPATVEEFAKALAGKLEAVELPESEDDLMGWLEVLNYQPDNEQAIAALTKLEAGYREASDWDGLVTLILGRVEFETETEGRVAMFKELAVIFEKEVGDLGKAFAAAKEAFRENTSNLDLRRDLERLAGATGMWNELLQEYSQLVQNLRDPKVACDWWVRIGQLYSSELGHDDYAIASFNQALTLDTNRADAMSELTEVLKRKGDHKEVARLLKRQADMEEDAARKAELLKDLARTYVKDLRSEEEAILTFRRILELDPTHTTAIAALEGLYRKQELWEELAQLLRDQIELADDAEALTRYRLSLAEVLSDKLGRPEEAIQIHQQQLGSDPGNLESMRGLERLYDQTGRNEEYLKILDQRIDAAGSDEEKAELCRRMASEWEAQANGQTKAAEYLEKVVGYTGGDDETFKALVRNYWALKEYKKLAQAYDKHINITKDPGDRAGLFAALGKVYEDHLEDPGRAIEVFNNLLAVDEESKIALTALARLYEKTGAWAQAVQMLERLTTKEESVDAQVELFYRMGMIQHGNLNREDEAEVSLTKALELKDEHVETMMALASLYRARKDFGKAARMLRDAGRHTANELEKVKRLHMSGVTYQDDLDDLDKALEVYEELMAIDPEHVATGDRLAAIYDKREQWDKAAPVLEMLVRKADPKDRANTIELNLRLGEVSLRCDHADKAVTAFRAAYDLDPTNQVALKRLATLLYERKENEEAGKLFQALLVHRRDTLDPSEIVDVFYKLGDIKQAMGEKSKALNMYEKALDLEPTNGRVLARAIELYKEKNDFEAVLRCKKNILKGTEDEADRLAMAEEIGDLLQEHLRRYNESIKFYKMVTEIKPDHRRVLNKIMEAYILQKKWDDAIVAMGKIEDHETDPTHRSRLHYTAAVIYRDELNKVQEAAFHLDQALVKDPTNRRAFDALRNLYTNQKNYKGLAKAYRLMLQRLPEETPKEEQVSLWNELGEICQEKLKDAKGAIVAFEVAAKLDPKDEARQEKLAQLYITAGPDAYEKAILANQRRLRTNPLRQEAYKELRRLYAEVGDYDKAWCVAAVLGWLKKGNEEETALYRKHRNEEPRRAARKLSEDLWREHLYHEKQDLVLNDVFATVAPVVAPMAVRPAKAHGLKGNEQLDVNNDTRPYARVADYIYQVLNQPLGAMYVRGEMEQERQLFPVLIGYKDEMSTAMQLSPKILQNENLTELHYWFTKAVALLRSEHFLSYATPSPTVMRAMALAFLKLVRPSTRLGGDTAEINKLVEVFRADLPANKLDVIADRGEQLRVASSEAGIEAWIEGVNLSTTRAALVLCDDLETTARLVSTEPTPGAPDHSARVKERLQELMVFAVSEDYFKLRELLGLQIK